MQHYDEMKNLWEKVCSSDSLREKLRPLDPIVFDIYQSRLEGKTPTQLAKELKTDISGISSRIAKFEWRMRQADKWFFGLQTSTVNVVAVIDEITSKDVLHEMILNGDFKPGKDNNFSNVHNITKTVFHECCVFVGLDPNEFLAKVSKEKQLKKMEGAKNAIKRSIDNLKKNGYTVLDPDGIAV